MKADRYTSAHPERNAIVIVLLLGLASAFADLVVWVLA